MSAGSTTPAGVPDALGTTRPLFNFLEIVRQMQEKDEALLEVIRGLVQSNLGLIQLIQTLPARIPPGKTREIHAVPLPRPMAVGE